nr:MAG: RNA-dependent RNA polymerase [Riboviria sp.]
MRSQESIIALKAIYDNHRCALSRQGEELSSKDNATAEEVIFQWLLLVHDVYLLNPEKHKRVIGGFISELFRSDLLDTLNAFANCTSLVQRQVGGFKAQLRDVCPSLIAIIREDVQKMCGGDVFAAQRLYQIFSYTSRLTLVDIDLTAQQEADYLQNEESLHDQWLPKSTIRSLNGIIRRWFPLSSVSEFDKNFGHGPGGVAGHGRTTLEVKYKDLSSDPLLEYAFDTFSIGKFRSTVDRISHTIFVPKSYKAFRTISMEATSLMYYQQGVWRWIDKVVNASWYLRNRIGFHDQSRNQSLAKQGSLNRNYATVDLSAASDLVSWQLVRKLFRGTPLLRYIYATRSRKTLLPSGRVVELKKFAPMGSALCFPIETIIFASICEFVTQEHGVKGDYSVFGDDIIVPTQCTQDLIYVLESLSFRANKDKSFFDPNCWFRESCGGDFVDGHNITPMRVSRKFNHQKQAEKYQADVDLANEAFKRGFMTLRRYFIQRANACGPQLFGYHGIQSNNATNFHLQHRGNAYLQCGEVRCVQLRTTYTKRDEEIALLAWLDMAKLRESVSEPLTARTGRPTVKLKTAWIPLP